VCSLPGTNRPFKYYIKNTVLHDTYVSHATSFCFVKKIIRPFFLHSRAVRREIYVNNCPSRCNYIQFIYICKPLYIVSGGIPPIIRSSCHCIHWMGIAVLIQSLSRQVAVTVLLVPHEVDTVTWAPDDGWRYHPKHVELFTIINKLYVVASSSTIIGIYHQTSFVINSRPVKLIMSYGIEISPLQYTS